MSLQSDLITALAAVAGGHVYPQAAPQDADFPFVIYKEIASEPLMTFAGYAGSTKTTVVLDCFATTKAAALALSGAVQTALDASGFREPQPASDYEAQADVFMESVAYSFWHA